MRPGKQTRKYNQRTRTLRHIAANPARTPGSTKRTRAKRGTVPAPLGRSTLRTAHLGRVIKKLNKAGRGDAAEALYVFCARTYRDGAIYASEA